MLFKDHVVADKIMKTTSPSKQRKLGRQVRNFDDDVWKAERERIVREGNYYKFTAAVDEDHREMLKKMLLETGDMELVEVWGVM